MIPIEVKKVLKEVLPHKKNLIIVAIAGTVGGLAQSSMPALIKFLIDSLQSKEHKVLILGPAMGIGLYFIGGVARYFQLYTMNYTGELVAQGLRSKLQNKFMRLNLTFHNTYISGSGGLMSRVLNDIKIIQDGLRMFADFFREPVMLIGLLCYLFYSNWRLTMSIFIILPLMLTFLRYISITIKKYSVQGLQELEEITSILKESLDGVRTIQSFNLEKELSNRFDEQGRTYLNSRRKVHQRVEIAGPVNEIIAATLIMGILVYMSFEIAAGRATVGDFISYLASLIMLNQPINKLQESYVRIQETTVAAKRAFQILDQDSEVRQHASPKPFPHHWQTITYKNVSFSYGNDMILKNINLTIQKGEMLAFVGSSGSGKSTIVNLLERFFDPTEGQILIDDIPIQDIDLKELRANIGLVSQDVFLFSDSIERNIWSGDFTKHPEKVLIAAKSANAHDFIMRNLMGYKSKVGDRGNLLSGGEKQRISIARAMLKDAPILILDEATSALDSVSELEVQKGLDQLMQGRTSLVIAHRLSTVSKAHRIILLKQGSIHEMGSHQELIHRKGEYFNLYQLQYG